MLKTPFVLNVSDEHEGKDEHKGGMGMLLSQVKVERVRWLWPGRIPLGKITMLDGDPGLGKSLITLDLIARVTTGRGMPDEPDEPDSLLRETAGEPHGAVLLSAEDGLGDTIAPRLLAAKDPEHPDHQRVLASSKSNLGPPPPALRYRLAVDEGQTQPRVEWLGTCDYTASLLLAASAEEEQPGALEEAMAWLEEQLAVGPRRGRRSSGWRGWRGSARAPCAAPASGSVRSRSAAASPRRHTPTGSCDLPPPRR